MTKNRRNTSGISMSTIFTHQDFVAKWKRLTSRECQTTKNLFEMCDLWLNAEGLSEADRQKRTLTNIYNTRPTWLDLAHTELYCKFADDLEFRDWILDVLFQKDYDKSIRGAAGA
jgi:hypothetical protein